MEACEENPAVTTFREYLRIPSVHPDINYGEDSPYNLFTKISFKVL